MQIFLMPQELESLVLPLVRQDRLWSVADGSVGSDQAWVPAGKVGQMPAVNEQFRGHILICTDRPPNSDPEDRLAGRCVRLELPTIANGVLQLVQHDARSDREEILRIADRFFRRMRNASSRPVWAWRTDDPTTARPYRNVSITPGAEAWWRSGRALGQMGSDFVRFGPEPE